MKRMRTGVLLGLGLSACWASVACSTASSTDVKNGSLKLDATVAAGPDSVVVNAQVLVGAGISPTRADLGGGDQLVAKLRGTSQTLAEKSAPLTNDIWYRTDFAGAFGDEELSLTFSRAAEPSLPDNKVVIPAAFSLQSPASNQATSRAAGFEVRWAPGRPGSTIEVRLAGSCITAFVRAVDDTGSYVVPANEVKVVVGADGGIPNPSCDIELRLSRSAAGTVDPGWGKGGRLSATQDRHIVLRSEP